MKLNFHKINSFFSSIHELIIIGSAQQHKAQVKEKVLYALSYKFKLCKEKLFQNCYLLSTFVLKREPNPNLVLQSELKFLKIILSGEKKMSGVGGLTSSLPLVSDQVTSNWNQN
jgi:hypothetical protein